VRCDHRSPCQPRICREVVHRVPMDLLVVVAEFG